MTFIGPFVSKHLSQWDAFPSAARPETWDSDVSLDLHLLPTSSMTVIINFRNCCWWQSDPFFSAEISAQKCWSVEGLKACRSNLSEGSDVLMVPRIYGLAIGVVSTDVNIIWPSIKSPIVEKKSDQQWPKRSIRFNSDQFDSIRSF